MHAPSTPQLEFAYRITALIGTPVTGGPGASGERLHIPITGGTVEGPRLTARILPGGSDWPVIRRDGASRIDARYTIETADGTPILVHSQGLRVSPPEVLARLRAGEAVPPAEYYFRTTASFDAPDGPHAWLREALFLGSAAPGAGQVVIDLYRVG